MLRLSRARESANAFLTPISIKQLVTPIRAVGRPIMYRWSRRNALSFGPDTPAGRTLAELHFEPALVHSFQRLEFAMLPGADLAI